MYCITEITHINLAISTTITMLCVVRQQKKKKENNRYKKSSFNKLHSNMTDWKDMFVCDTLKKHHISMYSIY